MTTLYASRMPEVRGDTGIRRMESQNVRAVVSPEYMPAVPMLLHALGKHANGYAAGCDVTVKTSWRRQERTASSLDKDIGSRHEHPKNNTTSPTSIEDTIHQNSEDQERLKRFLTQAAHAGDADESTALLARNTWAEISGRTTGILRVPFLEFGENGHILFVWREGRHYLDVEFAPGKSIEFFYEDCETHRLWEGEHDPTSGLISEEILQAFTHFRDVK